MVAIEAEADGEFTLIPLIPLGSCVQINATTERTGWIKLEIVGKDGRGLAECDPIMGDHAWTTVTWHGDATTGLDPRQPATIRIVTPQKNSTVFSSSERLLILRD